MFWTDGKVYTGEFCEGKMHGFGHMTWPGGSSYVGTFDHGHFQG